MYLRPNVQLEPLFNKWYAWPHLIAPVTAAMNVTHSHVKLMKSYVASPQVHAQALKNPAMSGGAFIDLDGQRVDEIRALLDETQRSSKDLLELSAAVKSLDDLLRAEGTGFALEGLYAKIPEPLRGYVELVYDLAGAPSARFLEGLLYRSKYYDTRRQSVVLSLATQDKRPFVLSTPRLPAPGQLHAAIPFAGEALRALVRAKTEDSSVDELAAQLGIPATDRETFDGLFTSEAPAAPQRYQGDGVRVRYFGHACVLFETRDVTVMTDPMVSYDYPTELPRFTYRDLPPTIDYVLITHSHQDHVLFETLLQIRDRVGTVLIPRTGNGQLEDPSLRMILQQLGFPRVVEVEDMEEISLPGGKVTGIPFFGEHGDLNVRTKVAHLLELGGHRMLLAADSNNIEPRMYDHVREALGDIDTIFLGMESQGAPYSWLYGPLSVRPIVRKNDQSRRLNGSDFEAGKAIVERFGCQRVFVYAMGLEPWGGHILAIHYTPESKAIVDSDALIAYCQGRGLETSRLYCKMEMVLS